MPVPLHARTIESADGITRVEAWLVGGQRVVKEAPIRPYLYLDQPAYAPAAPVTKRALSTLEPFTWYYAEFLSEKRRFFFQRDYVARGGKVAGDERFIERVVIEKPEWIRGLQPDIKPRLFYLDIEQLTDGKTFPKPDAPIISVAWAVDDAPVCCVVGPGCVEAFLCAFGCANPDIVIGFSHERYDLPRLALALGPRASQLTRDGTMPEFALDHEGRETAKLAGRVVWDVHPSTEVDQELQGCEDRKLKTIAKFLGMPVVESPGYDTASMTPANLKRYNVSDVVLLRDVARRYVWDKMALAEWTGAPLDRVMNGGSAYPASVVQARANLRAGVISDGSNAHRYDPFIPRETEGDRKGKPRKFQGATVALYKSGRFAPLWKKDFASLYPSIVVALGIGADNTRMVAYRDVDRESRIGYPAMNLIATQGETRTYQVLDFAMLADKKGNGPVRVFTIQVRGRSLFADEVDALMKQRLALKEQAKHEKDPAKKVELKGRTYIGKVVVNSAFGYEGADYAPHGSKAVAMLICAGARVAVAQLEDLVGHDAKVETDTDGVYYDRETGDVTPQINERLATQLAMRPVFNVETDRYDAAFFYLAKNYLLLEGEEMSAHGAAFKGTAHPELFRKVVASVGLAVLKGGNVASVARSARDLARYGPGDFAQKVRLTQAADGYKNEEAIALQVARSYAVRHGALSAVGERMRYFKTVLGYEVESPETFARIDRAYYREVIDDALVMLGALRREKGKKPVSATGR